MRTEEDEPSLPPGGTQPDPAARAGAPGPSSCPSPAPELAECRALAIDPDASRGGPSLAPSARFSKYTILARLGAGGMGIVWKAYDPDLDRNIALKLVNLERLGRASTRAGARMIREARAMARLEHPNVLTVYEAGTVDGQVYIAMELAAGGTLGQWIAAEPRPWREVVELYLAAGQGLAAAHAAGLAHRDFKPDNVLLTGDGRVRVTDFGLVGVDLDAGDGGASSGGLLGEAVTQTGARLGTPAYMAPEQHSGERAGVGADQFAFCVALWEALYGQRPFRGENYPELVQRVNEGIIDAPPGGRDVPPWLNARLRRGLSVREADRWPSMGALLAALADDPAAKRRQRWRRAGAAAAIAGLAGLAILGLLRGAPEEEPPCREMDRKLAGVWDPARASAAQAALLATGRPYAADTFDRVAALLEGYTRDWVAARVEACEATHVRGEQSARLLDLRMACLDRRLAEVGALVGVLAQAPGAEVLDKAVDAAADLTPLATCADAEALQAVSPLPDDPQTRAVVAQVRSKVAEAKALADTGQYRAGLPIAAAAEQLARRAAYAPAHAEALYRRGMLEGEAGDAKAARSTLEEALLVAADARDDALTVRIWARLLFAIGHRLRRPTEALALRPAAEAALRRVGADPEAEANLRDALGLALFALGSFDEAKREHRRALALIEERFGPDHLNVAVSLNNLGSIEGRQGRYADARRYLERALAIESRARGLAHPALAFPLTNLGLVYRHQGDYEAAQGVLERAITIREAALGREHSAVATSRSALAAVYAFQGKREQALEQYQLVLAVWEKALGPEHPFVGQTLDNLGIVLQELGRRDEAERYHRRGLAVLENAHGSDHPSLGDPLNNLGIVRQAAGAHDESRGLFLRAIAIWEKSLGPDHPDLARALSGLAEVDLELGRRAEALAAAERALRIHQAAEVPAETLAVQQFILSRALAAMDREPARARELARRARDGFAQGGATTRAKLAEVDRWLDTHGR